MQLKSKGCFREEAIIFELHIVRFNNCQEINWRWTCTLDIIFHYIKFEYILKLNKIFVF